MGWYGKQFYGNSMRDVRKAIEEDAGMTVVQIKYGYAICIVTQDDIDNREWLKDKPELLNLIVISLWRIADGHLMIKQVSEDMGPSEVDVPLKYVNALCKATINTEYAVDWRAKVIQYHRHRKEQNAIGKTLQAGDKFFVYGTLYRYLEPSHRRNRFTARRVHEGTTYSIRYNQISMER